MDNKYKKLIISLFSLLIFIFPIYICVSRSYWLELGTTIFIFICATMYHITDALHNTILFDEITWHKLDTISAILVIFSYIARMLELDFVKRCYINFISLLYIIYVQYYDPWNIHNTISPIIVALSILVYKIIFYTPKVNIMLLILLIIFLVLAAYTFKKGLADEDFKGLRIWHSIWHIFSISALTLALIMIKYD